MIVQKNQREMFGKALVWLVIVAPSLLDWLHGLLFIEYGIGLLSSLYRASLIGLGLYLYSVRPRRSPLNYILLLLIFFCTELLVWSMYSSIVTPIGELSLILNYILLLACYIIITYSVQDFYVKQEYILSAIVIYGTITAVIIITSLLFDIGVPTYSSEDGSVVYGFGTQSYYIAGNALGLTLVLSLLVSLYRFVTEKNIKNFIVTLVILSGSIAVGSRTGMFIAIAIFVSAIGYFVLFSKGYRILRLTIAMFVGLLAVYGGARVYDIVTSYPRLVEKYELLLEGSIRESHTDAAMRYTEGRPFIVTIFGEGYVSYTSQFGAFHDKKGHEGKVTAENDLADVFAAYGVFGLVFFYAPFFRGLIVSIMQFSKKRESLVFITICSLIMILGHSMLAGHVVFSAKTLQFSSVFLVLGLIWRKHNKGH